MDQKCTCLFLINDSYKPHKELDVVFALLAGDGGVDAVAFPAVQDIAGHLLCRSMTR